MATLLRFIVRFFQGMASRCRNVAYRRLGVNIQGYCWLRAVEIPRNWRDITLHGCSLDRGVVVLCSGTARSGKIEIGKGTYINRFTILDAHERIVIGKDVMIGPHVFITDANHGIKAGASVKNQPMRVESVEIGDGAWIGAHVVILPGVKIGHGAVIGAGSVVTRDIPAQAIAFGVPAMVKRTREPDAIHE